MESNEFLSFVRAQVDEWIDWFEGEHTRLEGLSREYERIHEHLAGRGGLVLPNDFSVDSDKEHAKLDRLQSEIATIEESPDYQLTSDGRVAERDLKACCATLAIYLCTQGDRRLLPAKFGRLSGDVPEEQLTSFFWLQLATMPDPTRLNFVGESERFANIESVVNRVLSEAPTSANSGPVNEIAPYTWSDEYEHDQWIYDNIHLHNFEDLSVKHQSIGKKKGWWAPFSRNQYKARARRFADHHGLPHRQFSSRRRKRQGVSDT